MKQTLIQFGFTEFEAELYIALLTLGQGTIDECVKIANVKRTTAYSIAKDLLRKGLIIELPYKPVRYRVLPPRETLDWVFKNKIEELKRTFSEMEEVADKVIKEAQSLFEEQPVYRNPNQEIILVHGSNISSEFTRPFIGKRDVIRSLTRLPILMGDEDGQERSPTPSNAERYLVFETEMLTIAGFRAALRYDIDGDTFHFRHIEKIPTKMMIFDDVGAIVIMKRNESPEENISLVVQNREMVGVLLRTFEDTWNRAEPVTKELIDEFESETASEK